ncbi:hypothetical protein CRG98_021333 [Punica granatum]|uniref:Uncharacterized protein n=1 Tax=Punica granatum TaxID=22663 RepID=A0A2I0JPS6_PUNGR|nr:hypothetical protein CRG98_021333 [Punica granatum]
MNYNAKIVNRFIDAQAYSSFGLLAQLDQFIDFTVSKQVYPVPLDPSDSTALDLRVVNNKWRLLLTRVRRASPGRWTLPSRVAQASRMRAPMRLNSTCSGELGRAVGRALESAGVAGAQASKWERRQVRVSKRALKRVSTSGRAKVTEYAGRLEVVDVDVQVHACKNANERQMCKGGAGARAGTGVRKRTCG